MYLLLLLLQGLAHARILLVCGRLHPKPVIIDNHPPTLHFNLTVRIVEVLINYAAVINLLDCGLHEGLQKRIRHLRIEEFHVAQIIEDIDLGQVLIEVDYFSNDGTGLIDLVRLDYNHCWHHQNPPQWYPVRNILLYFIDFPLNVRLVVLAQGVFFGEQAFHFGLQLFAVHRLIDLEPARF